MRTIDLSPLYRSIVGVDRMIDLIDAATRADASSGGYPPFNIEDAGDGSYRIELAVAGFAEDELSVDVTEGHLVIAGRKGSDGEKSYLHRGIAQRAFERRFRLADHVIVEGAQLENGLLVVELKRELPEAMKPRSIPIGGAKGKPKLITKDGVDAA